MMRLNAAACIAATYLFIPQTAFASGFFETGNELLADCQDRGAGNFKAGTCAAYVVGVADSHDAMMSALNVKLYCTPNGVTAGQIRDIAVAYLERHPEKRHFGAASLVANSLVEAFPCPSK